MRTRKELRKISAILSELAMNINDMRRQMPSDDLMRRIREDQYSTQNILSSFQKMLRQNECEHNGGAKIEISPDKEVIVRCTLCDQVAKCGPDKAIPRWASRMLDRADRKG